MLHKDELPRAFRLRHEIFVRTLGWVPCASDEVEQDRYDSSAVHFGVFQDTRLIAYLRAISGETLNAFLLGHEFRPLIESIAEKIDLHIRNHCSPSIEISRLAIKPEWSRTPEILRLLYRVLTEWAWHKNYRFWYMVTTRELFLSLSRQHFVLEKLAVGAFSPEGPECIVARFDLRATRENLKQKDPEAFRWYFGRLPQIPCPPPTS